jgi:ABC-type methionine transport system ATPase subunit
MTLNTDRATSAYGIGGSFSSSEVTHRIRQRIQIQISPRYAREPVISTLIARYEVEVNILSALLANNSRESGWFDLELCGIPARIQDALTYLSGLQIEILTDDAATQKSWAFH